MAAERKLEWLDSSSADQLDPALWGENTPPMVKGRRLTPTKVLAIRTLWTAGGFTQSDLATMFDTTPGTINHILRRVTWKWL